MGASLTRLLDEHDGISRTAGTILLMLDEHISRPNEAASMLAQLSDAVADHVAYEEQFVYPEITRAQNAELSDAGRMFDEEFEGLRGDWGDYLAAWPQQRILVEWADFKVETQEMLPRMLDRIRRENDCLYPMALRRGILTLR